MDYNSTANETSTLDDSIVIAMRSLSAINSAIFLYVALSQAVFCVSRFKKSSERSSDAINSICAFASGMVFLRVGFPIEEILDLSDDLNCTVVVVYKTVTYGLGLTLIWLVLWLRQRVFYQSPALKYLTSSIVKVLSVVVGFILIVGFFATQVMYYITQKYSGGISGCVLEEESYTSFMWIIIYVSGFFMELSLLGLFIYPLLKHKTSMGKSGKKVSNSEPTINIVIKRAAVTAAVAILMNFLAALTKYLIPASLIIVLTYVHDVNIGVEMLAIVCSFKSWRKRLVPWPCAFQKSRKHESKSFST